MGQTSLYSNNGTGGKISQRLDYNSAFARRQNALVEAMNVVCNTQGGIDKRPGYQNVGTLSVDVKRLAAWDSVSESGSLIGLTDEETGHRIISSDPSLGQLPSVSILGKYVDGVARKTRFTPLAAEAAGGLMLMTNGESMPYHIEVVGAGSVSPITQVILLGKREANETNYANYGRLQSSLAVFAENHLTEQHIAISDLPSNTHASVNALNIKNLRVGELRSTITFDSAGIATSISNNVRRLSTGHFTISNPTLDNTTGHFEFRISGALPNGISGINVYVGNGSDKTAQPFFVKRVPGRLLYGGTDDRFIDVNLNQIQISFRNAVSGEVATWNNRTDGAFQYANGVSGSFCWNRNFALTGNVPTDNPTGTVWRVRATGVTGPNATSAATGITGTATSLDLNSGGHGGYQACLQFNSVAWRNAFGTAHTNTSTAYTNAVWHLERAGTTIDIQDADFVAIGTTYVQSNRQPADLFKELVPGLLEAVYIRGNEYFTRDENATTGSNIGLRKLPYVEGGRPVTALYVNTSINEDILGNLDQYRRNVLPLVRGNTHTRTNLISEFVSLGNYLVSQATITHPPLVGPFPPSPGGDAIWAAARSAVGEEYCVEIPDTQVDYWGQAPDALKDSNGVDAVLPNSPHPTNFGGKINTQQKLDAEKAKQVFRLRVEPSQSNEVYRFPGRYCMQWNPRDGFPVCAALWDNRMVLGNSSAYKNRLWFSSEDKKFNFVFRSKNLNINQTTAGRAVRETDDIVDTFYGMQYDLDTDDPIQIIRASNSLVAFCLRSEHIISGRINANDKTWTRSQQFGAVGTQGNIGIVNIDKKLFTHNGQDAIGLAYIDDQSGYDDLNLSARFNEDIFKVANPVLGSDSNNDTVIRLAGGIIRDVPSAYRIHYLTKSGSIKVFHTLRNANDGEGFFAWTEWSSENLGGRQFIDMVVVDRRLLLLDDFGGIWYANPNNYHDDNSNGSETLPIECKIQTTSLISQNIPGEGWVFPKKICKAYVSSIGISEDTEINEQTGGRDSYNTVCIKPTGALGIPEYVLPIDIAVGTNLTIEEINREVNNIPIIYSRGMRKLDVEGMLNTFNGFYDPVSIEIKHRGRGPFNIARVEIIYETEVGTK